MQVSKQAEAEAVGKSWPPLHTEAAVAGVHLLPLGSPGSFPTSRGKKAFSIDTYPILTGSRTSFSSCFHTMYVPFVR